MDELESMSKIKSMLDNSIVDHKSRPPLRWFANLMGSLSSWALWNASLLDEEENFGFRYNLYSKIYRISWPVYYKYGTFYKLDFDMSGKNWDDYDEDGVPYWEKLGVVDPDYNGWDYEDLETGDAFRVIK